MTAPAIPRWWWREKAQAGDYLAGLRDSLGRSHYERMRLAMRPDLIIDPWEELPERSRESYRRHMDYVVPSLVAFINTLRGDGRNIYFSSEGLH